MNPVSAASVHHIGHRAAGEIGTILVVVVLVVGVLVVVVLAKVLTVGTAAGAPSDEAVTDTAKIEDAAMRRLAVILFIAFLLSVLGRVRVRLVERQRNTVTPMLANHLPFGWCERTLRREIRLCVLLPTSLLV